MFIGKGVRPLIDYQHKFENTYLRGSYSPITGDQFVWEINGVNRNIFKEYLEEFSKFKSEEYKIVIIDNAAFHSTKDWEIFFCSIFLPILQSLILANRFGNIKKSVLKINFLKPSKTLKSGCIKP
ncbi:hypothetical protein SAMN05444267_10803 [Chryseobacterium polytrichastri]|uniref:DDE superfamily endonuclease n=1 Tax=Chryseobacterium polytrichastri TaxID=1302687 RepID=A0A1M7L211_9FLAO|nr:hypothetical protein SAMN05444267_10803 [Chryseobacterium polytrichastri]